MFESATVKLTAWYLAIIVAVSLLFSVVIYSIASSEVGNRIGTIQSSSRPSFNLSLNKFNNIRDAQVHEAEGNLIGSLIITNACIWLAGGFGSYYLARRTLKPIEEAHEAQTRFSSDASHELRTPLASMKTELEVALRDPQLKKEEMRELLKSNLEEVNKLTKLSQMLLQLSQLDHASIKREKVLLQPAIKSATERFGKEAARVTFEGDKTLSVNANMSSVEELLTILLDNALKYSPERSSITITLIAQKQLVGFTVSNSGPGIPADILPHIFDRFYQADTSRTGGDKKGYGLGLALAKKIVELYNGELSVSSAPNTITTFKVLLPKFTQNPAKNQ